MAGKPDGFGVPQATPVSERDLEGIEDVMDAHRKGAYTRLLGLDDGHYAVRVVLTGSRGAEMSVCYSAQVGGTIWVKPA